MEKSITKISIDSEWNSVMTSTKAHMATRPNVRIIYFKIIIRNMRNRNSLCINFAQKSYFTGFNLASRLCTAHLRALK